MKKLILTVILLACLILLNGCIMQKEIALNFSVTNLAESRQKEVTLAVADSNNMPVKNAKVSYEQLSQDFMYNVGEYWDKGAGELGANTAGIYLDWDWKNLEPEDGVYNWDYLENTGLIDKQGRLTTKAEHIFLRLGVIATSAWIVGEKMDAFQETGYPVWVDKNNLTQVKLKYLEFVEALLEHLKFRPDFYMIEVEVNVLGINAGMTNQEIIEWLSQLTDEIKETDKDAKVSIVVTSSDLSPFMDEYRANNRVLVEQDKYPLRVTEFLEKMKDVNYDIISVPIQPFGWFSKGNSTDAIKFIDSLCGFNKTVYVAWLSFLAGQPNVPDELNPQPNGANTTGFIYYPSNSSEEWQKEQMLNLMNYIISEPCVAGVHWDFVDFTEIGVGGQNVNVRLATGFTSGYWNPETNENIPGEKRQVYEPMRELWFGLFSKGTLKTGENGEVKFSGLPGKYKVIVSHPDYKNKEIIIDI